MDKAKVKRIAVSAAVIATLFSGATAVSAQDQKINEIVTEVQSNNKLAQASQQRIDSISDKTSKLFAQYKAVLKVNAGLRAYNAQLSRVINAQNKEIGKIERAIGQVDEIKRQITPLMNEMIANLGEFVDQDIPFEITDRKNRVANLTEYMDDPNIADPERFRLVLAEYKTEVDYGRTYGAYEGELADGRLVNFVRIGRVGFYYQTKNGEESGVWNKSSGGWDVLEADYNKAVRDLSRMAGRSIPVAVLVLPIIAPGS